MDCVVTGGAGFIGSNLVDALVARGDRVTVIDNLLTGKRENLTNAAAKAAQPSRPSTSATRPPWPPFSRRRGRRPSFTWPPRSTSATRSSVPPTTLRPTCSGTIAVLEAARATGVTRVVNTSTGGGLYGDADVLPTPEDSPIRPLAPYGQSKLGAEGYCALYTRLHGLSTVSVRYGNVYGPRQDVHGEAGVVAIFCGHLIDGTAPTVFGDGGQTRDWVDVADVVRANLLAAESEITGPVNIGHGQETSVLRAHPGAQRCIAGQAAGRSDLSSPSGRARCAAAAWTSAGLGRSCAGRRQCRCATG